MRIFIAMDINAGIHDGHGGSFGGSGSAPLGHSTRAYDEFEKGADMQKAIVPEDIIA